jgi:hypothetical protein
MNSSSDPVPQRVAICVREDLFLLRGFLSTAECCGFIAFGEDPGLRGRDDGHRPQPLAGSGHPR